MILIAAIVPPIPQPQEYHQFADERSYLGIPNFFNVVSNLAFLFVGMAGLISLLSARVSPGYDTFIEPHERWPYLILFLSVAATGIGSAYYHLAPNNGRLMWDRLPIAIAIMALLSAALAERVGPRVGLRLLPVLVAVGASSVMYWYWSEQWGAGNLNFYIVVQFYSILLIVLLAIFFPSRYTRGADIYTVFAWYGAAKLAEIADREIYDLGHLMSGHTAKHVLAASGVYWILRMLKKRIPMTGESRAPY
ncbi:MAG: ceramidase domain-containing protein [Betaproteobacteria bacterium]|nr:ceramidase domain-containing protein [Betaproteobacteria bacterium]